MGYKKIFLIFHFTGRYHRIYNIYVSQHVSGDSARLENTSVVHGSISMNRHPAKKPNFELFFVGRLM